MFSGYEGLDLINLMCSYSCICTNVFIQTFYEILLPIFCLSLLICDFETAVSRFSVLIEVGDCKLFVKFFFSRRINSLISQLFFTNEQVLFTKIFPNTTSVFVIWTFVHTSWEWDLVTIIYIHIFVTGS